MRVTSYRRNLEGHRNAPPLPARACLLEQLPFRDGTYPRDVIDPAMRSRAGPVHHASTDTAESAADLSIPNADRVTDLHSRRTPSGTLWTLMHPTMAFEVRDVTWPVKAFRQGHARGEALPVKSEISWKQIPKHASIRDDLLSALYFH